MDWIKSSWRMVVMLCSHGEEWGAGPRPDIVMAGAILTAFPRGAAMLRYRESPRIQEAFLASLWRANRLKTNHHPCPLYV